MKKIICLILCLIFLLLSLASCSKPPEYAEIEARFRELVEASAVINQVFYGEGLPTYPRSDDPRSHTSVYEDPTTGARYYYYELTDETFGRIIAYQLSVTTHTYTDNDTKYFYYEIYDKTYGKIIAVTSSSLNGNLYLQILEEPREGESADYVNEDKKMYGYRLENYTYERYRYTYLQVLSEAKEGQIPYYQNEEEKLYYYLLSDYTEPTYTSVYGDDDPEEYDYITSDSPFLSVSSIKEAAEQVYSADYLNSVYDAMFLGSTAASDTVSGLSARYIEYENAENGNIYFMKSNTFTSYFSEVRQYDFSTATIIKPSNGKYVTISIDSYLPSNPSEVLTVRLSMILQDGVWLLDSPTY